MTSKLVVVGLLSGAVLAAWGDANVAPTDGGGRNAAPTENGDALVATSSRGRWTFSAGPSWRSRVTLKTSGAIFAPAPVARSTTKRDMTDSRNWTDPEKVPDPNAGTGGIPADGKLWGVSDTRTEVYGSAGGDYILDSTDEERPLGLNLQGCYDFLQGESWALGLNVRFAGYWNMKSSTGGRYNAGSTLTETWRDNYVFPEESPDALFDPDPSQATIEENGTTQQNSVLDTHGSRGVSTRFRGDLYQIGLGPKATWTPFAGVCSWMDWLDVYGGVEILCNISYAKLDADGWSTSSTDCLLGFGGNVGLVGNITDWCGIYGQVGYEWIDKTDVSAGAFSTEIDYSSLVLSAGVQFRF